MQRRVVVTGIGLMCGVGNTTPEVWKNLLAGKSGMAPITGFDTTGFSVTFAAEVKNFDPLTSWTRRNRARWRASSTSLSATREAMDISGLNITDDNSIASAFIGSGIGGFDIIEREHGAMLTAARKISPFFIPAAIINLAASRVSIKYGARGRTRRPQQPALPARTPLATPTASSSAATPTPLIAGARAAITPMGVGGFAAMRRALSARNDRSTPAVLRQGPRRLCCGEGAGILILEDLEFARARGAWFWPDHRCSMSAPLPHHQHGSEGEGCHRHEECDQERHYSTDRHPVCKCAPSTPVGDVLETLRWKALRRASHQRQAVISSTKSMTGHLLGGAGGLKPASPSWRCSTRSLRDDEPRQQDPECRLNYLPNKPQNVKIDIALSIPFGFGGTNGSLNFPPLARLTTQWRDASPARAGFLASVYLDRLNVLGLKPLAPRR